MMPTTIYWDNEENGVSANPLLSKIRKELTSQQSHAPELPPNILDAIHQLGASVLCGQVMASVHFGQIAASQQSPLNFDVPHSKSRYSSPPNPFP
jgi:hypothetical protein